MNLFSELLSEPVINALGWSLFHILWQGLVVAVIFSVILLFFKNKPAQIRYALSLISLIIIVGLSVFNFTNNFNRELSVPVKNVQNNQNGQNEFLLNDLEVFNIKTPKQIVFKFKNELTKIDRYFPAVVNIWIMGVFIFVLKLILGFIYTNRLRNIKTSQISENWIKKFDLIKSQLKVNKSIKYIKSQLANIPLVIGYFKPVIVIPAQMLTGMPFNQIEAIIAHEIAHIRRNDYILNVLQAIIETVFFFHPAVWYISSQIRKERENCCDDMALTICKESIVYAKALVSVQELILKKHYSAVAFSGKKKHLLNRVKRTIMKPKASLPKGKVKSNFTDRIIAAVILISGILTLSFTYSAKTYEYDSEAIFKDEIKVPASGMKKIVKPKSSGAALNKDTIYIKNNHKHNFIEIDDDKVIKTYKRNGGKYKLEFKMKNGKPYDLYVDGNKIPEEDYHKYQDEIDETITDLEEAKEDIREAMKDIEEIDIEQIQFEVQEAMKDVHIDVAEIHEEIAKAMEEVNMVDVEDIVKEVEASIDHLEDMDFDIDFDFDFAPDMHVELGEMDIDLDEIREELEKTRESIKENIDIEQIQKEMFKVQEELLRIDEEKLRMEIEEGLRAFEENDKEEVMNELQKKLEELEELELEEK